MKIKMKKFFDWVWQICQDCVICLSVKRVVGTHIFHIIYLYCFLRRRNVNFSFTTILTSADFPVKCPLFFYLIGFCDCYSTHLMGFFAFCFSFFSLSFLGCNFTLLAHTGTWTNPYFHIYAFHLGLYFLSIFGWFCKCLLFFFSIFYHDNLNWCLTKISSS